MEPEAICLLLQGKPDRDWQTDTGRQQGILCVLYKIQKCYLIADGGVQRLTVSSIVRSVCWIVPLATEVHPPCLPQFCALPQQRLHQGALMPSDFLLSLVNRDTSQEIRGRVGVRTGYLFGVLWLHLGQRSQLMKELCFFQINHLPT